MEQEVELASQIGQDAWVDDVFSGMRGGTFLDVGCGNYRLISNTWFLERSRNWRGVAIDVNPIHASGWEHQRPLSKFICGDATTMDYDSILDNAEMPNVVHYLSVDLEPPSLSLIALKRILQSRRSFLAVTFETDYYRYKLSRDPSRKLMRDLGYDLVRPGNQDDFWLLTSAL